MITSIMLWNEPNNLSHWDFQMDPEWRQFSAMTKMAARAIKEMARRYVLREAFGRTAGPECPAGVVASNRGGERHHYEQNQDRNRRTRQLCEQPAPGH